MKKINNFNMEENSINETQANNNEFSFENDYKRFHSEMTSEIKIAKKLKKILFKSKQNIRDRILTGEIKIGSKMNYYIGKLNLNQKKRKKI